MAIEIYLEYGTELDVSEASVKDYRWDVFVKKDSNFYRISVFTLVRLQQEIEMSKEYSEYYENDTNLVILKEITNEEIIRIMCHLEEECFFEQLLPLEQGEDWIKYFYNETFTTLSKKDMTRIY